MLKCKHITFVLTKRCNANCSECYVDQTGADFSINSYKKILDDLVRLGGKSVGLSGGEPLLYPLILEAISEAKKRYLQVSLVTNGILLTDSRAKQLKENGLDRLQISLDAGNSIENDKLRWNGAYDIVVNQAVPAAIRAGIKTTLVAVPNSYLIQNLREYLDLADSLGVSAVYFRRKIEKQEESDISKKQYLDFLNEIEDSKYRFQIYSGDPMHSVIKITKNNLNLQNVFAGCAAGITSLAIDANGNVLPCTRFPLVLGNIYQEDLKRIWEESGTLNELRGRNLKGKCGTCQYKYACGGCRALAYIRRHDYLGSDEMCLINI